MPCVSFLFNVIICKSGICFFCDSQNKSFINILDVLTSYIHSFYKHSIHTCCPFFYQEFLKIFIYHFLLQNSTPLDSTFPDNDDIKPPTSDLLTTAAAKLEKSKQLKLRKYRCPECPQVFAMLKEKRNHLVAAHNYEEKPWRNRITCTATSTSAMATSSTSASVDLAMPSTSGDLALVKHESTVAGGREPRARMNRYLLNYNWNILRQRLASQANGGEDVKFPIPPSTSSNSYMCMVCHELFASIKAYDAHMSVHPAECYTCGRLFKHWINLNVHLKRHLNIRDYSCVHCSKKFVSISFI